MIVEDEAQGVAQLTYRELPELTSRSVQVLRELGVDAGERVLDPPVQPHGLPGGLPGGAHGRSARHLASYNCPRAVHIVADLPRTANGKVLRLSLRRRA